MSSTEILLVNLSVHCNIKENVLYSVPIGLYCLSGNFDGKVTVVDKKANILDETLVLLNSNIKAVLCMLPEKLNEEKLKQFCLELKNKQPSIKIGLSKFVPSYKEYSDFIECGTGLETISKILNNEQFVLDKEAKELSPLPFSFNAEFQDNGYEIASEKILTEKTIEINKPWLGLQEQNSEINIIPDAKWIIELIKKLEEYEFTGFHFTPSGFNDIFINEISSLLPNNSKLQLAFSFSSETETEIAKQNKQIRQIWYYYPKDIDKLIACASNVLQNSLEACILINKNLSNISSMDFSLISRLVIEDEETWEQPELKEVLKKYWLTNGRFFKRLLTLHNAAELVAFTKSSYKMIETMMGKN